MLKELSLPNVFSSPKVRQIRASGIARVSGKRKALVFGLVILNLALLFAYILGVNNYASTGYEIKALQNEINRINQENKKLNLQVSERTSVSNLQEELSQSGFILVKSAKFVKQDQNQYSQK